VAKVTRATKVLEQANTGQRGLQVKIDPKEIQRVLNAVAAPLVNDG
jgi:hypothetical protein